jgi:serine/threonine protein kinase
VSDAEARQRAEELLSGFLEAQEREPAPDLAQFLAGQPAVDGATRAELERLLALYRDYAPLLDEWLEPNSGREQLQAALGSSDGDQRYRLGELLGEGGMGVVFAAEDPRLERRLALKRVRLTPGLDPAQELRRLARFVEEARIAGRLEHPGIVPIHELGCDGEGQPYFTMRLVQGRTLAELFAESRQATNSEWNLPRLVGLLQRVAETLAFAHHAGVIHRDLKPANVMVGSFGETYVVDWGLARRLSDGPGRAERVLGPSAPAQDNASSLDTLAGDVVGTPAYMAPEQALGDPEAVGPGVDIYALGALLYELLSGTAPFPGPSKAALEALRHGPPPALTRIAASAPRELIAIAERALQREPSQRYASMEALRDDLRAYLEGRVVSAYESGGLAELKKWTRRNRGLSAALLVLVAMLGLLAVFWAMRRAERVVGERFQDLERLADLTQEAERLWPALPSRTGALEAWLARARELVQRRAPLLDSLATQANPNGTRVADSRGNDMFSLSNPAQIPGNRAAAGSPSTAQYELPASTWRANKLEALARSVARFADPQQGTLAAVERRLASAKAIAQRFGASRALEQLSAIAPSATAPQELHSGALWPLLANLQPTSASPSLIFLHLPSCSLELLEAGPQALPAVIEASTLLETRFGIQLVPVTMPKGATCLLARTELTLAQWERLGGPAVGQLDGRLPARPLSWNAAAALLKAGNLRFPSQAECLAASAVPEGQPYWWGSVTGDWPLHEVMDAPVPELVASRRANPLGFYDLLGNLEEWCQEPSPNAAGQADLTRRSVFGPAYYLPLEAAESIWAARDEPFFYAVTDPRAETGVRPAADG